MKKTSTGNDETKGRRTKDPRGKRLVGFGTLALVLALFAGYYSHVSGQEKYYVERNLRLLSTWSREISETLQSYQKVFDLRIANAEFTRAREDDIERYKRRDFDPDPQKKSNSRGSPEGESSDNPPGSEVHKLRRELANAVAKLDRLKNADVRVYARDRFGVRGDPTVVSDCLNYSTKKTTGDGVAAQAHDDGLAWALASTDLPAFKIAGRSRGMGFSFKLVYCSALQTDQAEPGTGGSDARLVRVAAEIDAAQLLEGLATEGVFEDLILARNGIVVYQRSASQLRVASLEDLVAHQRSTGFFGLLGGMWTSAPPEAVKGDGTRQEQDGRTSFPTPTRRTVSPGGKSYELFAQPVLIPSGMAGPAGERDEWILVGLVSSDSFRADYLAIPYTYQLVAFFVVLSTLLILPTLRIVFMDPSEPIRSFNVLTVVLAALMGVGVFTFCVLDVYVYLTTKSQIKHQLKVTAESIARTFELELMQILRQLEHYDSPSKDYMKELGILPEKERQQRAASGGKTPVEDVVMRRVDPDQCVHIEEGCYPAIRLVYWMDPGGDHRASLYMTPEPQIQARYSLRGREYFQQFVVPDRKPWSLQSGRFPFYMQSIVSWSTGRNSVIVSRRSEHSPPGTNGMGKPSTRESWVAAIQPMTTSFLMKPAIPEGAGIAIIDRDGRVVFHSEPKRNLRESFFEETDMSSELRGLVYSRSSDSFEGYYWGRGHLFHVKPLKDVPWSLVVYWDKRVLRVVNFNVLAFAGSLFMGYLILAGFLVFVGYVGIVRPVQPDAMRWLWPAPEFSSRYLGILLFNALLLMVWFVVLWWPLPPTVAVFPYIAFVPLVLLVGMWLRYAAVRRGSRSDAASLRQSGFSVRSRSALARFGATGHTRAGEPGEFARVRFKIWYALMIVSFLMVFAAFPSATFFKVALDKELLLFVKHYQLSLAESLFDVSNDSARTWVQWVECDGETGQVQCWLTHVVERLGENMAGANDGLGYETIKHDEQVGIHQGFVNESIRPWMKMKWVMCKDETEGDACPMRQAAGPSIFLAGDAGVGEKTNFALNGIHKDFLLETEVRSNGDGGNRQCGVLPVDELQEQINWARGQVLGNPEEVQIWGLLPRQAGNGHERQWEECEVPHRDASTLRLTIPNFPFFTNGTGSHAEPVNLTITSEFPLPQRAPFGAREFSAFEIIGRLLGLLVFVLILYCLTRLVLDRVVLLGLQWPIPSPNLLGQEGFAVAGSSHVLVVGVPGSGKSDIITRCEKPGCRIFDLRSHMSSEDWHRPLLSEIGSAVEEGTNLVLLDHFDHRLGTPGHDRQKLALLDGILALRHARVCLASSIDPVVHSVGMWNGEAGQPDNESAGNRVTRAEWAKVLGRFARIYCCVPAAPASPIWLKNMSEDYRQKLWDESIVSQRLNELAQSLDEPRSKEGIKATEYGLVSSLCDLAGPYYAEIWASCSLEEKYGLFHVARDGFLHVGHPSLPLLFRKALVKLDPNLRLMNDSFSRFVLTAGNREELGTRERELTDSVWSWLKWPLILVLGLVACFLVVTQQELRAGLFGFLPLLPVLLPLFSEMTGVRVRGSGSAIPES